MIIIFFLFSFTKEAWPVKSSFCIRPSKNFLRKAVEYEPYKNHVLYLLNIS